MVQVAFICCICKQPYGDPMYTGPRGHCTSDTCLDCWSREWELSRNRHAPIGIQFLLENYHRKEIAALGLTLYELDKQRRNFDVEEFLSHKTGDFISVHGEDHD